MKFVQEPFDEVANEISEMMRNEEGIREIFENRTDRIASSEYSLLVEVDNQTIGFIDLVNENIRGFLFIDLGIKKSFREKGYSSIILNKLNDDLNTKEYLIAEIKKYNVPANKTLEKIGSLIDEVDDRNFYLLQKNRESELINNTEIYERLKKHNRNGVSKPKELVKTR
jgi:RimJ/RimL family protein N-acetyltransferase